MKRIEILINGNKAGEAGLADNYFLRLRGLIGRNAEDLGGLVIMPCAQIHTFFMSEPIDVVYIARDGQVLKVDAAVPVSRCCRAVRGSRCVLELPAGRAGGLGIRTGVHLTWNPLGR